MKPGIRIGTGYDSHRFVVGQPLVVGGIIIPHEYGLDGHSDADVLLHSVADALLGAAALGDIGQHFPDTDPQYKDISSIKLMTEVFRLIVREGYMIGNVDCTIIAEQPKMMPHIPAMKSKLSRILLVPEEKISIKAKTNEKMGFVGREEGIAVISSVLIYKDDGTDLQSDT